MPRITEVVILPVGEETQYVYQNQQAEPDKVKEPLIIEDMDIYAEEILLKKRKHQVRLMSPEQRKAFRAARQTAKKRLIEEGLLEPNKPKKERKRKQKQKQSES